MEFKQSELVANGAPESCTNFKSFKNVQDVFKAKYKQNYDTYAYSLFMDLRKEPGMAEYMEMSMNLTCTRDYIQCVNVMVLRINEQTVITDENIDFMLLKLPKDTPPCHHFPPSCCSTANAFWMQNIRRARQDKE